MQLQEKLMELGTKNDAVIEALFQTNFELIQLLRKRMDRLEQRTLEISEALRALSERLAENGLLESK